MSAASPEFDVWADGARGKKVHEVCTDRYQSAKLKKSSEGLTGECPKCGGQDRFSINLKKNIWNCRGCGKGGDAIALLMSVEDLSFVDAVTEITGEPPPAAKKNGAERADMPDDTVARERREERRDKEIKQETEEEQRKRKAREAVLAIWGGLTPFAASPAQSYLKARAIDLLPEQHADLRFAPEMEYRGFKDSDAQEETVLGRFPVMVAAIRDAAGEIMGIHRTYLSNDTAAKLRPPGDSARNAAKKVYGQQKGGHIRLGPVVECMALGEGIETTVSWYLLGIGPEDVGIMAGINLGNLAGKMTGSLPHPRYASKKIPNGEPDMGAPGLILPPNIKSMILLGDSDSDPYVTRMKILCAARRFRAQGIDVSICWPNEDGVDFNDIHRRMAA